MFYPVVVMFVAGGVMTLMMLFVIPKFKDVRRIDWQRGPAGVHHLVLNPATWFGIMRSAPDHAGGQRHHLPAHHPHQVWTVCLLINSN